MPVGDLASRHPYLQWRTDMFRLALLLSSMAMGLLSAEAPRHSLIVIDDPEPDTSKTIRLRRWATNAESNRFHSVNGMPRRKVLQTLGHPCQVKREADGTEVWSYGWGIDWRIFIKNGVCIDTWSNDGW